MFALPVSMKQRSIRKIVSELFEEGLGDLKDKAHQCQAQNNNFTSRPLSELFGLLVIRRANNNAKLLTWADNALLLTTTTCANRFAQQHFSFSCGRRLAEILMFDLWRPALRIQSGCIVAYLHDRSSVVLSHPIGGARRRIC